MKIEMTWHGPVRDVYYIVEADDENAAEQILLHFIAGQDFDCEDGDCPDCNSVTEVR